MTATTLIILNPHAGSGRAGEIWREIEPTLWAHMGEMIVAVTENADEVARHVEKAYAVGVRRVIALGGDGTNHALVNALAHFNQQYAGDSPMIYGNIPVGTGRDWARGQGMPFTDPMSIARWIINATPTPTDVGKVSFNPGSADQSHEYFLNIASAGLGGEVAKRVNRMPKRSWTFLEATIRTVIGYRPQPFEVTVDGQEWYEGDAYVVAVANGTTFGHGMKIAPEARTSDGLFDVILVKGVSRLTVLTALRRVYNATHLTHPGVLSIRGREIAIRSPRRQSGGLIEMELDGEFSAARDVVFSVQPKLLNILL
ncbi:MAG: diacylglycerol kinase family lipid kinase [Anaerolinea sp.]|nr:diacylglycerol kinase family lipid kinase [Anaerolinea sp.]